MANDPNIFVGTLYTIENEFDECCAAIRRQTYPHFAHHIFRGLPNKEAHDTLYRTFMQRAGEFDIMIKVDADMIIENRNLFADIVERFSARPHMKDLEITLFDQLSEQSIWGLHAYRNTVRWRRTEENLFVDSRNADIRADEHVRDDHDLAPAAIHMKNPSPFQAFHYGIHKAVKLLAPDRTAPSSFPAYKENYWRIIEGLYRVFIKGGDVRAGIACLGAEMGLRGGVLPQHLDYANPHLAAMFAAVAALDRPQILRRIQRYRFLSLGALPPAWRYRLLFALRRRSARRSNK